MGLFDMFTKEGKLKRHVRRMSDLNTQPEDREASARWLVDEGSGKAIMGLLSRFDMNVTQQLKDQAEKAFVYQLLVNMGEAVHRPLDAWLRRCKQYAWPLKLCVELQGEQVAMTAVFALLAGDVGKSSFEPEKRKELLVWLAERKHPEMVEHVAGFLKDFDEEVRYAAAEVLVAQETEAARPALLAVLADPQEDSVRLKHRLAGVFRTRGWSVGDAGLPQLPAGFDVRDGRIVAL
ncbi:MAG: HEAT repeat domain-containing protein [Alphaproteobacteria bacterium]|nr:HEAT repeat domain-containing protein [Alphaproteobacteria bacterium]